VGTTADETGVVVVSLANGANCDINGLNASTPSRTPPSGACDTALLSRSLAALRTLAHRRE
jgi:hypothetical protein